MSESMHQLEVIENTLSVHVSSSNYCGKYCGIVVKSGGRWWWGLMLIAVEGREFPKRNAVL